MMDVVKAFTNTSNRYLFNILIVFDQLYAVKTLIFALTTKNSTNLTSKIVAKTFERGGEIRVEENRFESRTKTF